MLSNVIGKQSKKINKQLIFKECQTGVSFSRKKQKMSTPQQVSVNFLLMQEKIETQKGENKILRQKLQSKSEALIILSQELDKVRNESEDYRELTRRLQTQWSLLSSDLGGPSNVSIFNNSNQKIAELRDENKRLVTEREHLRKILNDRDEDIKLIRKQWLKEKHLHPTIGKNFLKIAQLFCNN